MFIRCSRWSRGNFEDVVAVPVKTSNIRVRTLLSHSTIGRGYIELVVSIAHCRQRDTRKSCYRNRTSNQSLRKHDPTRLSQSSQQCTTIALHEDLDCCSVGMGVGVGGLHDAVRYLSGSREYLLRQSMPKYHLNLFWWSGLYRCTITKNTSLTVQISCENNNLELSSKLSTVFLSVLDVGFD